MREIFRLAECEGEFLTRSQGEHVRTKLLDSYERVCSGDALVIDFAGVELMTPSFADDCFGKLAEIIGFAKFRQSVSVTGGNDIVRALLNSVLAERGAGGKAKAG